MRSALALILAFVALARGGVPRAGRTALSRAPCVASAASFATVATDAVAIAPRAARVVRLRHARKRAAVACSSAPPAHAPQRRRLRIEVPRVAPGQLALGMLVGLAWPQVARVLTGLALLCQLAAAALACACWLVRRRALAAPLVAVCPPLGGWLRSALTSPLRAGSNSGGGGSSSPSASSSVRSVVLVNVSVNGGEAGAQAEPQPWVEGAFDMLADAEPAAATGVEAAALREAESLAVGGGGYHMAAAQPAEPPVNSLAVAYDRARRLSAAPPPANGARPPLGSPPDARAREMPPAGPVALRAGAAAQRAAQGIASQRATDSSAVRSPASGARPGVAAPAARARNEPGPAGVAPAPAIPEAARARANAPAADASPPAAAVVAQTSARFASRAEQLAYEQMLSRSIAWTPAQQPGLSPAPSVARTPTPRPARAAEPDDGAGGRSAAPQR
ncbi:hypothetical protein KFE25_010251 [Diacronema lutheri]|uniref:Uncharacterized protein n=1 Tax=Diacronema lutheri TaxID=2081491 RepID=A0A8J5XDN1_DIALT|nr:hypothetical protein KFE25_010251 [Diacronema lutheri]